MQAPKILFLGENNVWCCSWNVGQCWLGRGGRGRAPKTEDQREYSPRWQRESSLIEVWEGVDKTLRRLGIRHLKWNYEFRLCLANWWDTLPAAVFILLSFSPVTRCCWSAELWRVCRWLCIVNQHLVQVRSMCRRFLILVSTAKTTVSSSQVGSPANGHWCLL